MSPVNISTGVVWDFSNRSFVVPAYSRVVATVLSQLISTRKFLSLKPFANVVIQFGRKVAHVTMGGSPPTWSVKFLSHFGEIWAMCGNPTLCCQRSIESEPVGLRWKIHSSGSLAPVSVKTVRLQRCQYTQKNWVNYLIVEPIVL